MTAAQHPLHEPARPAWSCATCDEEWPCRRRRAMLRAEFGDSKLQLAVHLAWYIGEAMRERPDLTATVLHHRFLGWLRVRR